MTYLIKKFQDVLAILKYTLNLVDQLNIINIICKIKKTEKIKQKIRAFIIFLNNPLVLSCLTFNHNFQLNFLNTMKRKSLI